MNQLGFPSAVSTQELAREKTLGGAIGLCIKAAGYEPKEAIEKLKMDKAQWSRWESGTEGVIWPKFEALMDFCGNDAPLLWMLNARGYDLSSLRRKESEIEKKLREAEEKLARVELEREVERRMWRDMRVAA